MIDEKRLAEIEAREKAATPLPWIRFQVPEIGLDIGNLIHKHHPAESPKDTDWEKLSDADRAFLLHARQDIPDLLAEVRRLNSEVEATRALLIEWKRVYGETIGSENLDARIAVERATEAYLTGQTSRPSRTGAERTEEKG